MNVGGPLGKILTALMGILFLSIGVQIMVEPFADAVTVRSGVGANGTLVTASITVSSGASVGSFPTSLIKFLPTTA